MITTTVPFVTVFLPWVGLAVLGAVVPLAWNELISPRLARNKFNALENDLNELANHLANLPISEGFILARVLTIRAQMDSLKVDTPPIDERNDWIRWIVHMIPLVRTRDVKSARKWKTGGPLPKVRL